VAYGLFAEHTLADLTQWRGEDGQVTTYYLLLTTYYLLLTTYYLLLADLTQWRGEDGQVRNRGTSRVRVRLSPLP
jgi:hypothetical protein